MDELNGNHKQTGISLGKTREGLLHLEVKAEDDPANYHNLALVIDLLSGQGKAEDKLSKSERLFAILIVACIVIFVAGCIGLWWATKGVN